tara:strand:+ start:364 stop:615 length:252 start_codon:yes stop_codon:yes gene_type:complete
LPYLRRRAGGFVEFSRIKRLQCKPCHNGEKDTGAGETITAAENRYGKAEAGVDEESSTSSENCGAVESILVNKKKCRKKCLFL